MKRILVATDGSIGGDRAVDYAAQLAKDHGADLLIVNIIGGYGLPDKVFMAFTNAQQTWLEELLTSLSAEMLTKARDRARDAGVATIQLELTHRQRRPDHHRNCARKGNRCHRRRQARRWICHRTAARQRLAEACKSIAPARDGRSLNRDRRSYDGRAPIRTGHANLLDYSM